MGPEKSHGSTVLSLAVPPPCLVRSALATVTLRAPARHSSNSQRLASDAAFSSSICLASASADPTVFAASDIWRSSSVLLVALGQGRADLLVVGRAYLFGRLRLLLLVVGLRVALLPLLLLALCLRAILLTVHKDRLPYQAGEEIACSRFHVGNRLLVRHK